MLTLQLAVVCAALALAVLPHCSAYTEASSSFLAWRTQYGKEYTTVEEEALRAAVFAANVAMINAHNSAIGTSASEPSWTMALNEYADLTSTEFATGRLGGALPPRPQASTSSQLKLSSHNNLEPLKVKYANVGDDDVPDSVDWRLKGVVTPVKNQGQCGDCWAFSSTGALESATALHTGTLYSFSEQQLTDCTVEAGNYGCSGGWMDKAFHYVINRGGICSEDSYPYTAVNGTCKDSTCSTISDAAINGVGYVTPDDEGALLAAVATQPVSVTIEADQHAFQFYSSGVFSGACGSNNDHAVLVVGYVTSPTPYWIVKNSWGASWGQSGYMLMARGANSGSDPYNNGAGQCGILSNSMYPTFN